MGAYSSSRSLLENIMQSIGARRPFLSPSVVEGGQLSHHPLAEEGWAGRGRGERSQRGRSALMKLIYL